MKTNTFYCESTQPKYGDKQNFLDPAPRSLWNFSGSFHITGYVFGFWGADSKLYDINQNQKLGTEVLSVSGRSYVPAQADRVVIADVIISDGNTETLPGRNSNNYNDVDGGFYMSHLSSHLNKNLPTGGHLGFKDGHVQWRQFKLMHNRVDPAKGGKYFWW